MTEREDGQVTWFGPDTWSGRTYREPFPAQKEQTLRRSLKKSSKSANREPMCMCVFRTRDGENPGATTLRMVPGQLLGEFTMRSFGECPSEENASRLSQILEDCPHPRYSLSARACAGILTRANGRGKKLPEELEKALLTQSGSGKVVRGGGKGALVQRERSGALGCNQDQTVFCLKGNAIDRDTAQNGQWANEDVSYSLDATDWHGVAIPVNTQIATRHKALGERTGLGIGADGDPAFTLQAGHEHGVAVLNDQGGSMMSVTHEVTGTLRSQEHGHQPVVAGFKWNQGSGAGSIGYAEETSPTLNTENNPAIYDARGNGNGAISPTLTGDHQNRVTDYTAVVTFAEQSHGDYKKSDVGSNQNARQGKSATDLICCGLDCRNGRENAELSGTLQAKENGGYSYNCTHPIRQAMTVRRLTPLECERFQGFPDGWTDIGEWTDSKGKKRQTTDTARYKALGNSIALPFWFWLLRRISAQYERPATLGSLFDGISGFPIVWAMCNGAENCLWSSEVEDFCVAVAKKHFGDESTGQKGDFYEAIEH